MFRVVELQKVKAFLLSTFRIVWKKFSIFHKEFKFFVTVNVATLDTAKSNVDELIRLMVGREMTREYPTRDPELVTDEVILEFQDVTGNGNKNISFQLHKGEILGFGGLVGAGRTEVAELLFGVKPIESGRILYKGKDINFAAPREAIDQGIALLTEDRKKYGLLLHMDIKDNTAMPIYQRISKSSVIDEKTERAIAEKYFEALRVKAPSTQELTRNLSGGNQQKVIIAKWLAADAELLIFDEPTRGIDVGAKNEIYLLINDLIEEGKSVILISSEMEELMGVSDRIIVLAEGEMAGELKKDEFDADVILTMASNIKNRGMGV